MDSGAEKGALTITPMAPRNGRPMSHHRIDPNSYFVSCRSMAVTYYLLPGDDEFTFIGSSLGNDAYMAAAYEAFEAKTGKDAVSDVIGNLVMNY